MAKIQKIDWRIIAVAIVGLTVIEVAAMFNGINGALRTVVVGAIAAMAGLVIPFDKYIKK